MKKLLCLLVFCIVASCTTKRNPNLCEYFWLSGLDLEVGCIKLTNDAYEGDGFLPDHSALSEGIVDEKCEAELLNYFGKSEKWKFGQIDTIIQEKIWQKGDLPMDYNYYYRLYYHESDYSSLVDKYSLGFYDPKTREIRYSSFEM